MCPLSTRAKMNILSCLGLPRLKLKFKRGSLPPTMPLEFVGCIGGCDETLKEIFGLRFSRGPPRASQPSGHLQASQALNRMDSSQHGLSQPLDNRHTGPSKAMSQTFPPSTAAGESNSVTCNCGQEAVLLTVRKPGPNQGRHFYKCGGGGCNFFLWADSSHPPSSASGPSGNSGRYPSALGSGADGFGGLGGDSDGTTSCLCGQPAVTRTVQKDGPNKGRQFHTCAKPREQQCGFFQWVDENVAPGEGARQQVPSEVLTVASIAETREEGRQMSVVEDQQGLGFASVSSLFIEVGTRGSWVHIEE